MALIFGALRMIFYTAIILVAIESSHQQIYPCNSTAACGCSSNPASLSRIVGGESAGTSTWSWAVSLSITEGSGTALCGGAILSSSWIITAAHCMAGIAASEVTVYAGSNVRYNGQSRVASRVIVHPGYVSRTKVNDIALLQLSAPLAMTTDVTTICIPSVLSSTLIDGEWPPADLTVCYIIIFNVLANQKSFFIDRL